MRWKLVIAAGFAVVSAASAVACELLLPTIEKDGDSGAGPAPVGDECNHVRPPDRPDASAKAGSIRFFAAVKTFGLGDAGPDVGYDLDDTCTCEVDAQSCVPTTGKEFCDRGGGRDIEGNELIGQSLANVLAATGFGTIDSRIALGKVSYLFEVRDYNGEPDDDQVYVGAYNSNGLGELDDAGSILNPRPPSWDGEDRWSVDCKHAFTCPKAPTTWIGDAGPDALVALYADQKAYVRNNTLVAHLPVVVLAIGSSYMRVSNALVTADLERTPAGYGVSRGQIAGRLATRDIFDLLATVRLEVDKNVTYVCGNNPMFLDYRSKICTSADINAEGNDHNGAPCNAMSIAVPFTAGPAKLGFHYDREDPVRGCPATNDECTQR